MPKGEKLSKVDPGERRRQDAIESARAIFVKPTRWQEQLQEAGVHIDDQEGLGVGSSESLPLELELMGRKRADARVLAREMETAIRGGELHSIFKTPENSLVGFRITRLEGGAYFFARSTLSEREARRRYEAYKSLLEAAIEQKREQEQEKREKEQEEQRIKKAEAKAEKPSMAVIQFFSYVKGTSPVALQQLVAAFRTGMQGEAVVEELNDYSYPFSDRSARVIPRVVAKKILENGITPENLNNMVGRVREALIKGLQAAEEHADYLALDILGTVSQKTAVRGRRFIFPALVQRSFAPLLYSSLSYKIGENQNIIIAQDFGRMYPSITYPDGVMHRFALRLTPGVLKAQREAFEEQRENPVAAFLLEALDEGDAEVFIALRNGQEIEINGNRLTLSDVDSFLAPLILDDSLLITTIFVDVLGEVFPLPYKEHGEEREEDLVGLHMLGRMLFTLDQITQVLAPEDIDGAGRQQAIENLKAEIRKKETEARSIKGSGREAGQRKRTLDADVATFARQLRFAVQGGKRETRGEKIKRMMKECLPQRRPRAVDYKGGENSPGYREVLRAYEKNPELLKPDPAHYEGGEEAYAYQRDLAICNMFLVLSNDNKKTVYIDESSLVSADAL